MSVTRKEPMRRLVSLSPRFIIFVLLLLTVVFGILMSIKSAQVKRLSAEAEAIQIKVLEAYALVEELERRLAFTDTDDFIRQEARSRFGYMEEGEIRFVVQDDPDENGAASP